VSKLERGKFTQEPVKTQFGSVVSQRFSEERALNGRIFRL